MPPLNTLELLVGQIEGKLLNISSTVDRITTDVVDLQKKVVALETNLGNLEKISTKHVNDCPFNDNTEIKKLINDEVDKELNRRAVAAPKERRESVYKVLGIVSLVISILIGLVVLNEKFNKSETKPPLPKTELKK